ncbi:MAG: asparagine synthase-related protein [Phycisphaerae bacterium]|nr:asparagine synthase-related protein [Phycisphaerae bacterium]
MRICSKCVLPETYPETSFDDNGVCNFCRSFRPFRPEPQAHLEKALKKARREAKGQYEVLVPFSGGKDSSYVLYLAAKVYKLKILSYTYDNGLLTPPSLDNIRAVTQTLGVDHLFFKPSAPLLMRLYKAALVCSGEMCGPCGIGIVRSYRRVAMAYGIPVVLQGAVPMEEGSGSPESIYDCARFRAIMETSGGVTKDELESFFMFPIRSELAEFIMLRFGKLPREIPLLYYHPRKSEQEVRDLLVNETGWKDMSETNLSKHFDCLAEPFTNYVREKRLGYSRRTCQYSNLIRLGEMTREEAVRRLQEEKPDEEPPCTNQVLERLDVPRQALDGVLRVPPLAYEENCMRKSRVLSMARAAKRTLKRVLGK